MMSLLGCCLSLSVSAYHLYQDRSIIGIWHGFLFHSFLQCRDRPGWRWLTWLCIKSIKHTKFYAESHTTVVEDSSHRMLMILNISLYQGKQDLSVHHFPSIMHHFGNVRCVLGSLSSKNSKPVWRDSPNNESNSSVALCINYICKGKREIKTVGKGRKCRTY